MRLYKLLIVLAALFSCQQPEKTDTVPVPAADSNVVFVESFLKAFNAHDWAALGAMYTDTVEMMDPAMGLDVVRMSRADIQKKYTELQQLIPDVKDSLVAVYSVNGIITVEFESSGTGPDQKRFRLPICTVFRMEKGKIASDHTYYDNTDALPPPPPPAK